MADYLTTALSGLGTTTAETPWGFAGKTLLEASPLLINRQRPSGGNLAAAFGTALLGGLIAYKGRQDAAEQTAEATSLAQQIQAAKTPEERLALAQSAESGGVRNKLTSLVNALQIQQSANEQSLAQKKAELQLALESEMSPLAKELRQIKLNDRIKEIDALYNNKQELQEAKGTTAASKKDWWASLSKTEQDKFKQARGQINALRTLANQFENLDSMGVSLQIQSAYPGSDADLAISNMKTLVPSTVRLLGDTGNLAQEEQQRLIDATLGSKLSGSQSIAKRLNQLANVAETKIGESAKTAKLGFEQGGDAILADLTGEAPIETEAQKRNRELKERLANLERLVAGR